MQKQCFKHVSNDKYATEWNCDSDQKDRSVSSFCFHRWVNDEVTQKREVDDAKGEKKFVEYHENIQSAATHRSLLSKPNQEEGLGQIKQ